MPNDRKNLRHITLARARIKSISDGEAILRDLSITGCCIEFSVSVDIKLETDYIMEVIPERASQIENFELAVTSRWIKTTAYSCEIGFTIASQPKILPFQRYLEYLSWRSPPA